MLFLHLVPLGLALAFSTVPILAAFIIVLSPARSRSAIPYLVGLVCGIFLLAGLAALAAQNLPDWTHPHQDNAVIGTVEIVLGILLVGVGAWSFLRGQRRLHALAAAPTEVTEAQEISETAETTDAGATADGLPASGPAWLRSVAKLGPRSSFGVALLLNVRPKALLLAIAAGVALHADAGSPTNAVIALAIYTLIGASTVAIPIIAAVAAPNRVDRPLTVARGWLLTHGNLVTSVILVVVGIIVIVLGTGRL